ncbi:hypothetical protein HLB44_34905 [Aquincola sp. S2]|uniref:Uncharacterized protein n=1 Tax=Pseudaquabacterium terrae TaxID=2732868 RepID=A0ABX2EUM9_9BURK|nr:hypothetical protein [Aquabacterium terrae]NRF72187.1 hypothetical protein [Aquabacterium terrae]
MPLKIGPNTSVSLRRGDVLEKLQARAKTHARDPILKPRPDGSSKSPKLVLRNPAPAGPLTDAPVTTQLPGAAKLAPAATPGATTSADAPGTVILPKWQAPFSQRFSSHRRSAIRTPGAAC